MKRVNVHNLSVGYRFVEAYVEDTVPHPHAYGYGIALKALKQVQEAQYLTSRYRVVKRYSVKLKNGFNHSIGVTAITNWANRSPVKTGVGLAYRV